MTCDNRASTLVPAHRPRHTQAAFSRSLKLLSITLVVATGCAPVTKPPISDRAEAPSDERPREPPSIRIPPSESHPRDVRLGSSVEGRPLIMHVFGDGDETVFIFGGIHGSEPASAAVAQMLISYLHDHPEATADRTIAILAAANPDGLTHHRRTNANGVDLNRNFPARNWRRAGGDGRRHGPSAASEPETRAIMRAIEALDPTRIIAIHAIGGRKQCNNYDGPAEALAALMNEFNHYPINANIGYRTPGSFGSWAGIDRRIPTITLELPLGRSGEQCWEENRAALLAVLQTSPSTLGK